MGGGAHERIRGDGRDGAGHLCSGLGAGHPHFRFLGYLKNLAPSLGLPIYLAIFILPLVYAIEALSLLIKHGVLAVRLLANMVAGHLVLLGFIGIGFGAMRSA